MLAQGICCHVGPILLHHLCLVARLFHQFTLHFAVAGRKVIKTIREKNVDRQKLSLGGLEQRDIKIYVLNDTDSKDSQNGSSNRSRVTICILESERFSVYSFS